MALAAFLASSARGSAYTEYCPVDVSVRPVGVAAGQPSTLYSAVLSALTPRTVSGTIVLGTADSWYAVPFENQQLQPVDERWQDQFATYVRKEPMSGVFYLRFERPVTITHAYLRTGTVTGEKILGWDTQEHGCEPDDHPLLDESSKNPRLLQGPVGAESPPVVSSTVLIPHTIVPPGLTDCAVPFADAKLAHFSIPHLEDAFSAYNISQAQAFVQVAVSKTGSIDDAWLWKTTGNDAFDRAALLSAKRSTYAPRRAFCKDEPGMYLFVVTYR
jgi:hypothetical protein